MTTRHLSAWLGRAVGAALGSILSEASLAAAVPSPSEEQVRRSLDNVYARPEFSLDENFNLGQWLERQLGRFFKWLGELGATHPAIFWILLLSCITLLLLLLAHIVWTIHRALAGNPTLSSVEAALAKRERLSSSYFKEAAEKARQGEFTEAIRFLYLSLVFRFDESGRVNFLKAYTNREYLALFADRPEIHSALLLFVDSLDDFWYAQKATNQGQYQDCLAKYEGLQ